MRLPSEHGDPAAAAHQIVGQSEQQQGIAKFIGNQESDMFGRSHEKVLQNMNDSYHIVTPEKRQCRRALAAK